jgi:aminopeptidase N
LPLNGDEATFRFVDVMEPPVVSLLRGYSAPVRLDQSADDATLARLVRHDTDGFNRWFASDTLARRLFAKALGSPEADAALLALWSDSIRATFDEPAVDLALLAEILTVADAPSLTAGLSDIDPESVHRARSQIESGLARALAAPLLERYTSLGDGGADVALAAQAKRRLRNICLAAVCRVDPNHLELARAQFSGARNLTDRLAALGVLVSSGASDAQAALDAFAARYAGDAMVLDKWFTTQATQPQPETLARVQALTAHPAFRWHTPNSVYALLVAFAHRNPRVFHRVDGAAYRFVADAVARLDAINPQVAARLVTAFGVWRSYEPVRRALMRHELERLAARRENSPDLADLVGRALAGA